MVGLRKYHKIRKISNNNNEYDCYGITIREDIARCFMGCTMKQTKSGTCIILESGAYEVLK